MTDSYASAADLEARLSDGYTMPPTPEKALLKASELIDFVTFGRAQALWDADPESISAAFVTRAVCDQVEFWLETGEEHDVLGLAGMLNGGRVQVSRIPGQLAPRARRNLIVAGIYYAGAGIR